MFAIAQSCVETTTYPIIAERWADGNTSRQKYVLSACLIDQLHSWVKQRPILWIWHLKCWEVFIAHCGSCNVVNGAFTLVFCKCLVMGNGMIFWGISLVPIRINWLTCSKEISAQVVWIIYRNLWSQSSTMGIGKHCRLETTTTATELWAAVRVPDAHGDKGRNLLNNNSHLQNWFDYQPSPSWKYLHSRLLIRKDKQFSIVWGGEREATANMATCWTRITEQKKNTFFL